METKLKSIFVILLLCVGYCINCFGTEITVAVGPDPYINGTNLKTAIEVTAVSGDTVILPQATYSLGWSAGITVNKAIDIKSTNPTDWNTVENTIISEFSPAFVLSGSGMAWNNTISGITFFDNWNATGGAIEDHGTEYTISNCLFKENGADYGGAVWSEMAGGMPLQFTKCKFINNTSNYQAGAVYGDNSWLSFDNCWFEDNVRDNQIYGVDIALENCSVLVNSCTFRATSLGMELGYHIYCTDTNSGASVVSTVFDDFESYGGSIYTNVLYDQGGNSSFDTCCFSLGTNKGSHSTVNCIDASPLLETNGVPKYNSQCINAGKIAWPSSSTDLANSNRKDGSSIDIGAYEYQGTIEVSGTIATDTTWTLKTYYVTSNITVTSSATLTIEPSTVVKFNDNCSLTALEGKIVANGTSIENIIFTSKNDDSVGQIISGSTGSPLNNDWNMIAVDKNSQLDHYEVKYAENAVNWHVYPVENDWSNNENLRKVIEDYAQPGDTVVIHPGTYYLNFDSIDVSNRIIITGKDPTDWATVESTVLTEGSPAFKLLSNYDHRISGLKFYQNCGDNGGAIQDNGTEPTISNCIFIDNSATYGGAAWSSDSCGMPARFTKCKFINNLTNATFQGGAVYGTGTWLAFDNCWFENNGNSGNLYGDDIAVYATWTDINSCTFNSTSYDLEWGYNIYCTQSIDGYGGVNIISTIFNNWITMYALYDQGIYSQFSNCCFSPWTMTYNNTNSTFTDCINANPLLAENGVPYPQSPCIGKGKTELLQDSTDLANSERIIYNIDMGAYETNFANELDSDYDSIPDEWEDHFGLDKNDPNDAEIDSDSDGLNNRQEYFVGTNPNSNNTDGDDFNDLDEIASFNLNPTEADPDTDEDGIPDSLDFDETLYTPSIPVISDTSYTFNSNGDGTYDLTVNAIITSANLHFVTIDNHVIEDTGNPYSYTLKNIYPGDYQIIVRARDYSGHYAYSLVNCSMSTTPATGIPGGLHTILPASKHTTIHCTSFAPFNRKRSFAIVGYDEGDVVVPGPEDLIKIVVEKEGLNVDLKQEYFVEPVGEMRAFAKLVKLYPGKNNIYIMTPHCVLERTIVVIPEPIAILVHHDVDWIIKMEGCVPPPLESGLRFFVEGDYMSQYTDEILIGKNTGDWNGPSECYYTCGAEYAYLYFLNDAGLSYLQHPQPDPHNFEEFKQESSLRAYSPKGFYYDDYSGPGQSGGGYEIANALATHSIIRSNNIGTVGAYRVVDEDTWLPVHGAGKYDISSHGIFMANFYDGHWIHNAPNSGITSVENIIFGPYDPSPENDIFISSEQGFQFETMVKFFLWDGRGAGLLNTLSSCDETLVYKNTSPYHNSQYVALQGYFTGDSDTYDMFAYKMDIDIESFNTTLTFNAGTSEEINVKEEPIENWYCRSISPSASGLVPLYIELKGYYDGSSPNNIKDLDLTIDYACTSPGIPDMTIWTDTSKTTSVTSGVTYKASDFGMTDGSDTITLYVEVMDGHFVFIDATLSLPNNIFSEDLYKRIRYINAP